MRLRVNRAIEKDGDQQLECPGLDALAIWSVERLDDARPVQPSILCNQG